MIAFRIELNGEHICTAGLEQQGVLTAVVSWLRSTSLNETSGEPIEQGCEENLTFNVGGLARDADGSGANLKWVDRTLQEGDEICIKVIQALQVDEPVKREREDPDFVGQQERQYYEALKKKYAE
ncbi:MAG: hypothetical protein HC899_23755 [Leptolyngbyaceae cyanobacterium SM1_4_3]|nr:hypothetical protein [Leptolyngbyaceae cyanobacterium SM1_4_3]